MLLATLSSESEIDSDVAYCQMEYADHHASNSTTKSRRNDGSEIPTCSGYTSSFFVGNNLKC